MTVFRDAGWMERRNLVASALGYRPDEPRTWNIEAVEHLTKIREQRGEEAYFKELNKLTGR